MLSQPVIRWIIGRYSYEMVFRRSAHVVPTPRITGPVKRVEPVKLESDLVLPA